MGAESLLTLFYIMPEVLHEVSVLARCANPYYLPLPPPAGGMGVMSRMRMISSGKGAGSRLENFRLSLAGGLPIRQPEKIAVLRLDELGRQPPGVPGTMPHFP